MARPLPISFLEKSYALAKGFQYPERGRLSKQNTDHLQLLDAIALLLARSDSVAVSLERKTGEVVFYWATNHPVTVEDKEYLSSLMDVITDGTPSDDRVEGVLGEVVRGCRNKLDSRMEELKIAIENNGELLSAISGAAGKVGFCEHLEKVLSEFFEVDSPVEFVLSYFQCFAELDIAGLSPNQLGILVRVANAVSSYDRIAEVVRDPELVGRLRLVGSYLGACKRVVRAVDYHWELDIRFVAVDVPAQATVRLPADCTDIFNRLAVEYGVDTAEEAGRRQSRAANSDIDTPSPDTPSVCEDHITITGSVHAECSVALQLLSAGKRWKNITIGTSHGSCWFCIQYLKLLQECCGVEFAVTDSNGNAQPGWMLPHTGPELVEVHEGMQQKVAEGLRRIIEQQRRGAGSE